MALNNRLSDIITNFNTLNNSQNNTLNKLSTIDSNLNILTTNLSINQTNGLLVYDKNISTAFDNENDALKVNIVSGTITDADGKAYLYDGSTTNAITSTAVTSSIRGIDTASALYSTDGSSLTALTSTDNSGKQSLDVNISNTSIPVTGTFYQATQPVSGTVSANIKDSSGNNLNSTSNALNSYITNTSIPVTGTFYQATQPVSGTVSANIKDSSGNNLNSTSNALNSYITNTSIPVTGTFYQATQPVSGTVSANIKDSSGNNLNSTSNALNSYITNTSIPVTGTFYQATQPVSGTVSSNIKDSSGNNLNSTSNALNSYITNTSIPVTGTFYQATQPVSGTVSANIKDGSGTSITSTTISAKQAIDVNVAGGTITGADGKAYLYNGAGNTAITSTVITASINGIDTTSSLYTTNGTTRTALTSTLNSSKQSLDVNISNEQTANTTISGYTASGLNMYQILPKMKSYAVCGSNNHPVNDAMLAGQGSTFTVSSYAWGKANANKSFWLYTAAGGNVRTISYNYINSSGDEVTATATGIVNAYVALQTNIVGVNNFTITGNVQPTATDGLYITLANTGTVTLSVASMRDVRFNNNNAIFTVPNNAIAMVTNIDAIIGTANDFFYMNVWDANGNRTTPWVGTMFQNTTINVSNYRVGAGDYGCIGRVLLAGETVAFTTLQTTSTNKNVLANIKVIYF